MSEKTCSNFRSLLFTAGLCLIGNALFSQSPAVINTISPYSRYGIGELQMSGSLFNAGMAGGGIGYRNDSLLPQFINLQNPASFTGHYIIAYEVGMNSNTVMLRSASDKGSFNTTQLSNVTLAFPVSKWWGAGFGLMPYSNMGYNVTSDDSLQGIGPVTYKYQGNGGVNELFLVNAIRPFAGSPRRFLLSQDYENLRLTNDTSAMKKKLRCRNELANISIGLNTSFMFGTLYNIRRDVFPDSMNNLNGKISKRTTFHDAHYTIGIQYTFRYPRTINPLYTGLADSLVTRTKFFGNRFWYKNRNEIDTAQLFIHKPGARVTVGTVFSPPVNLGVTYDLLAQSYKQVGPFESIRDTIVYDKDIFSTVTMPMMGGLGFAVKGDYKWAFQADWMMQLWSKTEFMGVNAGLQNSQRITAAFQFQPKQAGRGNYLSVVQYRIGARYYRTNLEIHSVQLTEYAVNLSFSLPAPYRVKLGEPISRATVSFEYGFRGTTDHQLIREDFFRVSFGLTINDRWFNKVKYD